MIKETKEFKYSVRHEKEELEKMSAQVKDSLKQDEKFLGLIKRFRRETDAQKEYIEAKEEEISDKYEKNKVFLGTILMGVFLNILANQLDNFVVESLEGTNIDVIIYRVIIFISAIIAISYIVWKIWFKDKAIKNKIAELKLKNVELRENIDDHEKKYNATTQELLEVLEGIKKLEKFHEKE